jgi:co-chaperonin GroES (HSP10)
MIDNYKFTSDRVLIDIEHDQADVTDGIIVLPQNYKAPGAYVVGTVKAVGPGWMPKGKTNESDRYPMMVKVGDKVWIHKASLSSTVTINNYSYIIIRENEVIAIIE